LDVVIETLGVSEEDMATVVDTDADSEAEGDTLKDAETEPSTKTGVSRMTPKGGNSKVGPWSTTTPAVASKLPGDNHM
jgi:hypothetical protein